jgi:two-component system chemotaxis response regulator CheY
MSFRVLIVDDSPSMRKMIRRVITLSGLDAETVFEAGDGIEALEIVEQEWVDVILTDINMPRMNGEELIRQLAAKGITESVPVIVISTDATSLRRENVSGLGARGYIVKPFLPEALRDEIERVTGVACGD